MSMWTTYFTKSEIIRLIAFFCTAFGIGSNNNIIYINHIIHIHQLQNLYFALTNKELTYETKK